MRAMLSQLIQPFLWQRLSALLGHACRFKGSFKGTQQRNPAHLNVAVLQHPTMFCVYLLISAIVTSDFDRTCKCVHIVKESLGVMHVLSTFEECIMEPI